MRRVLETNKGVCTGFSMVFMEHNGTDIDWKFKTYMAFDPQNPPPQEERDRLEAAFALLSRFIERVMNDKEEVGRA